MFIGSVEAFQKEKEHIIKKMLYEMFVVFRANCSFSL